MRDKILDESKRVFTRFLTGWTKSSLVGKPELLRIVELEVHKK